jgi:hypothetical protein
VAGAHYLLAPGASPIREISRDRQVVATAAGTRGLFVVDQRGRVASAAADTEMRVESAGPLSASVRFEGFYRTAGGEPLARHITRVEFYANRASAHVTHTLVLTRNTNDTWFREVGWELALRQPAAEAIFAGSPYHAWQQTTVVPLGGAQPAASAFQRDHIQFRGGAKVAQILGLDPRGGETVLHTAEEMGDWAVATGRSGGLMVACRDSARQHPKEIEIGQGRVTLRLFSNRGGDELDFRPAALLARWNRGGLVREEDASKIAVTPTNAAGWAKTHELLFEPLPPGEPSARLAQAGRAFSQQVYANIDPQWIYESRVMGPLYPKDPQRFPDAERFVERAMAAHLPKGHERDQEYGFVDYFAGPHYRTMGIYRYMLSYSVRMAPWALYARSGERPLRAFAEGTNRRNLDNVITHWDGGADGSRADDPPAPPDPAGTPPADDDDDDEGGFGGRVRGLYATTGGSITGLYPYYWGSSANPYGGGGPNNLNQFLWDYQLTGYRRAHDMLEAYVAGMQNWWRPGIRTAYRLKVLRNLWLAYAETWDQGLRPLIEDFFKLVYDPEGEVGVAFNGISKYTTYKTDEDTAGIIYAWEMHGDRRVGDLARRLADYTWQHGLGRDPGRYDKGTIADFLYRETDDATVPQETLNFVQTLMVESATTESPSGANPRLFGIPYALSTIAQSGVDRQPLTAYAGVDSYEYPCWFIVRKPDRERVVLHLRGRNVGLSRVDLQSRMQLPSIWQRAEYTRLVLPKDLFGGTYKIAGEMEMIQADRMLPMVLYAPQYFRPMAAAQNPPLRIYFKVPDGLNVQPQICFEAPTQLYDPTGAAFGQPVRGWVNLPPERAGLWSFQSSNHGLVRVNNLPPFFAFHFPDVYFEPEIPWSKGPPISAPERPAAGIAFVPGAGRSSADQAIWLDGQRQLVIAAGPDHASGEGGRYLPAGEGTVEFFLKPYWDSLELYPRASKTLVTIDTDKRPWTLTYGSHTFEANLWTLSPEAEFSRRAAGADSGQMFPKRAYARHKAIVEQESWLHVAWVWGPEPHDRHGSVLPGFATRLYINGRRARAIGPQWLVAQPDGTPAALAIGRGMAAVVDGLRVSDVGRYHGSFQPPANDGELQVDRHTRLLLRFNGNLDGEAFSEQGGVTAVQAAKIESLAEPGKPAARPTRNASTQ